MHMNRQRPLLLALTMGDPAGIGPEIAARALCGPGPEPGCEVIVVGDAAIMERAARLVGAGTAVKALQTVRDIEPGAINVLDAAAVSERDFTLGVPSTACGRAAYAYVLKGIELAMEGSVDGIVTGPINKEALKMAGIDYPGHTEILADKTRTQDYSMVFVLESVAVAHVTTHCSLRRAIELVSRPRVVKHIRLLHGALTGMGIDRPRLAVGGLNPHAGEHGLFGDEEQRHIAPAVGDARAEGMNVTGPLPPDTVFMRAFKGEFDGVVAMLHDHGFVALKSRDFDKGVNITIGLPIVRTSVGHGTAFDLAGTGRASEKSLVEAIRAAARLARSRRH
jgi:4-hydroxythreonine-4-phosphate dehydrogenase